MTVSLGSTLATILLSADVALAQGLLALVLLIALQFAMTWSSVRWRWVRRMITGEPSLLLFRGQYLHAALRRSRVAEDEVRAAIRGKGFAALDDVDAVVLETNGSFSVIGSHNGPPTSLSGVRMPNDTRARDRYTVRSPPRRRG